MKPGDKFIDINGDTWIFLEYYNKGRAFDFIAKNTKGVLRNFINEHIKRIL